MSHTALRLARAAWLILPVIAAGLVHVVVLKTNLLRSLAVPVDGGRQWRSSPLLGPNKTWRGFLLMTALTGELMRLQSMVERRTDLGQIAVSRDYRLGPRLSGSILGLSYCLAELPNSFIKRRLGIPASGRSSRYPRTQYVVDQVDSVIGCLIVLRLLYRPRRGDLWLALVLGSAAHVGVDQLLHAIGVKRRA